MSILVALLLLPAAYFTVDWLSTAAWVPEGVRTLLDTDETGIIFAQAMVFIAFLVLALVQALVVQAEEQVLETAHAGVSWPYRLGGLPADWPNILARGTPMPRESLEWLLAQHAESRLLLLRFLAGAFPISGFIGTVIGIRQAIRPLGDLAGGDLDVSALSGSLGQVVIGLEVAFDTTLMGLILFLPALLVVQLLSSGVQRQHTRLLVAAGA